MKKEIIIKKLEEIESFLEENKTRHYRDLQEDFLEVNIKINSKYFDIEKEEEKELKKIDSLKLQNKDKIKKEIKEFFSNENYFYELSRDYYESQLEQFLEDAGQNWQYEEKDSKYYNFYESIKVDNFKILGRSGGYLNFKSEMYFNLEDIQTILYELKEENKNLNELEEYTKEEFLENYLEDLKKFKYLKLFFKYIKQLKKDVEKYEHEEIRYNIKENINYIIKNNPDLNPIINLNIELNKEKLNFLNSFFTEYKKVNNIEINYNDFIKENLKKFINEKFYKNLITEFIPMNLFK